MRHFFPDARAAGYTSPWRHAAGFTLAEALAAATAGALALAGSVALQARLTQQAWHLDAHTRALWQIENLHQQLVILPDSSATRFVFTPTQALTCPYEALGGPFSTRTAQAVDWYRALICELPEVRVHWAFADGVSRVRLEWPQASARDALQLTLGGPEP